MTIPTTIFLSYAGVDRESAARICAGLQGAGVNVGWDLDYISWGDKWQDRLQEELSRCQGYIILIGQSGIRRWVKPELQFALRRHIEDGDLPIFPLLLPGVTPEDLPPFLSMFQARPLPDLIDTSDFESLAAELQAAVKGSETRLEPDWSVEPYPGLESFGEADAGFFFGREVETVELLARLGERPGAPYTRWLQVEGTSGVGKSSLLHAGLVPAVKRGWIEKESTRKRGDWVVAKLRPGKDSVMNLQIALSTALPNGSFDALDNSNSDNKALTRTIRLATNESGARVLLVIDQLEELFTMADGDVRSRFDELLAHALTEPDCPLYLVTGIRSDFMMRFSELEQLSTLLNDSAARFYLKPIAESGLRSAVISPAREAGLRFSDGLPATIVTEGLGAGEAALPLVANVLRLLWDRSRARGDGVLSADDYNTLRGVAGALADSADGVVDSLDAKSREAARKLLLALVIPGRDGPDTRKRITRQEALQTAGGGAVGERVLERLSGSADPGNPRSPGPRLVLVGKGDDPPVDLVHELLLRSDYRGRPYWPRFKEWVDEYRDELKLHDRFHDCAQDWDDAGRPWRGGYLVLGEELRDFDVLSPPKGTGKDYLQASHRWRRIRVSSIAAIVAGVGFVVWFVADAGRRYGIGYAIGYYELIVPEMITVGGGEFVMGSPIGDNDASPDERPTRAVMVRAFAIGRYEVTFEQYDQFALLMGREFPNDQGWGRGDRPVMNVSWGDGQAYANWLSSETDEPFRLPTEAEWEYAARAETTGSYWWCADGEPNCTVPPGIANCDGCGSEWDNKQTAPVGSFGANPFGLHDTAGNVWEWTDDCWHEDYQDAPQDGSAWREENDGDCAQRAIRGGSWGYFPEFLRSANRVRGTRDGWDINLGFRLVQDK